MTGTDMGSAGVWLLLFWFSVIGGSLRLLALLFPRRRSPQTEIGRDEGTLAILQRRYARGEITRREYEAIRRELERT